MSDFETGHGRFDPGTSKSRHKAGLVERGLDVVCLKSLDEIIALKDEWRTLERACVAEMAYFQGYDWCVTWWKTFAADASGPTAPRLRVFTVRRDGKLVMLWPMMIMSRPFGLRKLTPIGSDLAQYGGFLVDPGQVTGDDINACWDFLGKQADVDLVVIDRVPEQTLLAKGLGEGGPATVCDTTSIIDLSGINCRSELGADAKASTRRNRKKRRNKLAAGKELELVAIHGDSKAYHPMVELGYEWKAVWLRETGRFSSSVTETRTSEFMAELCDGAVALVLKRDGVPVAMEIGFMRGDHFYSYFGAFDWSLKRLSPGRVQIEEALDWMLGEGLKYYDLLGNPTTYKLGMSNLGIDLQTFARPSSFRGYAYARIWRNAARPMLKQSFYAISTGPRRRLVSAISWLKSLTSPSGESNSKERKVTNVDAGQPAHR